MSRLPYRVLPLFPGFLELRRPLAGDPARDCCARSFARGPGGRLRVLECIRPKHDLEEPCNPWPVSPDPRTLACPECSSGPGEPCAAPSGEPCKTHRARLELAARSGVWLERPNRDIPGPECHTTRELEDLEAGELLELAGVCECGGAFREPFRVSRPDLIARARRGEHVGMTHCDDCREPVPVFLERAG